jgi:hypothetical protein
MAGDIVGHKPDVNLFSFAEYLAACCEDEGAEKGFGEFAKILRSFAPRSFIGNAEGNASRLRPKSTASRSDLVQVLPTLTETKE